MFLHEIYDFTHHLARPGGLVDARLVKVAEN